MTEKTGDNLTIFVIADSTGKTAETLINSIAIQFDIDSLKFRKFTNVDNISRLSTIINEAKNEENVIIAYTLVLPELCQYIEDEADKYNIPIIDILGPFLTRFSRILDRQPQLEVGLSYNPDLDVINRIKCIDFSVRCDDGKDLNKLKEADIVLIGVSRTYKTPLSIFLSHRKYKVATISLSPEVIPPRELYEIESEKIVGLMTKPSFLQKVRQNRLKQMDFCQKGSGYVNLDRIKEELNYAEKIIDEIECKKVDISYKSVEDIAFEII